MSPSAPEDDAGAPLSDVSLLRMTRLGTQTWNASAHVILPLLTPLAEKAWAVGWEPEVRWQAEGNGEGTLFVTRSLSGTETVWLLDTFDTSRLHVGYVRVSPGALVVELSLSLTPLPSARTRARIRYTFTALSGEGNGRIPTEEQFAASMRDWERQLNHFLETGRKLDEGR